MEQLQGELVGLLRGFDAKQWAKPTACAGWSVKDVAAHLLDGHMRRLSLCRDGHSIAFEGGDLGAWLNGLNAQWVGATRRLSARVLVELHELYGPQVMEFWRGLDPRGKAFFAVGWAGEAESEVWFDCARDFTEHWHHQQQIREATGSASLMNREYYPVVLSILMRSVPVAYAGVDEAAVVGIAAIGEAGGEWTLERRGDKSRWEIREGRASAGTDCRIEMAERDVWLLFTKKLTPGEAAGRARVTGDRRWAEPFFGSRAVMG